MIDVERSDDVFVVTMNDDQNRWNTTFTRALDRALDEVTASDGPAAMVLASANEKFFSNGLDLEWMSTRGEHPGGDRRVFNSEVMALFARVMTFPVPTVCAIGGHAFGAGLMIALCHDVRVMRADRGFLCANEVELGFAIPEPELALFRHKVPMPAFYDTVMLARRWSGTDALAEGMVQHAVDADEVLSTAVERAAGLAHLAKHRTVFQWMKEHIYGEHAALNHPHGPAHMLRHQEQYPASPGSIPAAP